VDNLGTKNCNLGKIMVIFAVAACRLSVHQTTQIEMVCTLCRSAPIDSFFSETEKQFALEAMFIHQLPLQFANIYTLRWLRAR
jgi:hypothetical protein